MKNYHIPLIWLLFFSITANGQGITWEKGKKQLLIGKTIQILEDSEGSFSIEEVSSNAFAEKFEKSENVILNFGFTESYYWLKFSLQNTTAEELLLEIASSHLPVTNLYFQVPEGNWVEQQSGYNIPLPDKQIKHHFQVFPLPKNANEFYIKVLAKSFPLPIRVWEKEAYAIQSNKQRIFYGIYLGLMFFVILNSLLLFFSLRNGMYLFYSFVIFIYVCYTALVMDGFALYFIPNLDMLFWHTLIPEIGVVIQLIYCILFLESSKYVPKVTKIAWGVIGYFLFYLLIRLFLPITDVIIVQGINTLNALISFFMMGFVGVQVGKHGNKLGYYFAVAYFIYFLLVLTEAVYIQTGKPGYLIGLSHVAIATLIEAFGLSYLLSKKFEWEKRDIVLAREEAQKKVIEATKEKEQIVREQNILLEQKVTERTEALNATLQTVVLERKKSDDLLLNILPSITAIELKENGAAKPQTYESVSVLFTDFKNFTTLSENIAPEKLVDNLNQYFSEFDQIVQKHNLEKIKTVGDAYMAAGGLPVPNATHAKDTILAALEIQAFIQKWKKYQIEHKELVWDLRIGIHTGKVVSGVVGKHKFSYDIWGDTVNIASRMESNGQPGKINISATTFDLVQTHFHCTPRGKMEVKGKGKMDMYFVDSVKEIQRIS